MHPSPGPLCMGDQHIKKVRPLLSHTAWLKKSISCVYLLFYIGSKNCYVIIWYTWLNLSFHTMSQQGRSCPVARGAVVQNFNTPSKHYIYVTDRGTVVRQSWKLQTLTFIPDHHPNFFEFNHIGRDSRLFTLHSSSGPKSTCQEHLNNSVVPDLWHLHN